MTPPRRKTWDSQEEKLRKTQKKKNMKGILSPIEIV